MDLQLSGSDSEDGERTDRYDPSSNLTLRTFTLDRRGAAGDSRPDTLHGAGRHCNTDPRSWSRDELLVNVRALLEVVVMQEKYIEHQEEKMLRNEELMASIGAATEESWKHLQRMKHGCVNPTIRTSLSENTNNTIEHDDTDSSARDGVEPLIHDDEPVQQKEELETTRDEELETTRDEELETTRDKMRRDLIESGIPEYVINEAMATKHTHSRDMEMSRELKRDATDDSYEGRTCSSDTSEESDSNDTLLTSRVSSELSRETANIGITYRVSQPMFDHLGTGDTTLIDQELPTVPVQLSDITASPFIPYTPTGSQTPVYLGNDSSSTVNIPRLDMDGITDNQSKPNVSSTSITYRVDQPRFGDIGGDGSALRLESSLTDVSDESSISINISLELNEDSPEQMEPDCIFESAANSETPI